MPFVERAGASIYYEVHGQSGGAPLLLLAPGGLNSSLAFWGRMPLDPLAAFGDEFRLIAMDRRNAGQSRGPLEPADPGACTRSTSWPSSTRSASSGRS